MYIISNNIYIIELSILTGEYQLNLTKVFHSIRIERFRTMFTFEAWRHDCQVVAALVIYWISNSHGTFVS